MPEAPSASNLPELSVSELSFALKKAIEDQFGFVRVRGEVGRVSRPGSGHIYLDLKDDKAVINGVIWKGVSSRLRIQPEQGLEVVCTGKLTTFPGQSRYQIIIETMEPAGVGALMALLEERRKKLQAEGLFEAARKKPLPYLPQVIGVVTSPTGAVIRDILHRLTDRFPRHVIVAPVLVQGEKAADQIAAAIRTFNEMAADGPIPRPDVLIVARGGGSIEDLWAFNEEVVVRAAAESAIPLISAVGHETDTTLIDYASDRRAPTPTAAAEMAVPVRAELLSDVLGLEGRLIRANERLLESLRQRLTGAARGLPRLTELLGLPQQRFDAASSALGAALQSNLRRHELQLATSAAGLRLTAVRGNLRQAHASLDSLSKNLKAASDRAISRAEDRLSGAAKMLDALSYQRVLERGYSVTRDAAGNIISSTKAVPSGAEGSVEFTDGRAGVIFSGAPAKPKVAKKSPKRASKPKKDEEADGQGRLL
ncbi:MAG: exodeoxyribonuclease VII large subunit [Alphaproteobacteria bacterium]|nr:MAG: exodeoxyribonuclease VII large subunit [Alphaproteobacteria bacterium]